MAPSTRLGVRPERRVDYRHATPTARAGSIRNPIVVEEPSTPAPVVRSTKTKEKNVAKPARDAQGRFIKSERSIKSKTADRNRVVKKTPPKPTEQARPEKTECVICASSKSTQRSFNAFNVEGTCAHFGNVCDHCIQTQIRTMMSVRLLTEAHLPCMFPECEAVLDHAALKKILSKALFETWDVAVTKHVLAADASYIACLNPKCGVYFSTGDCGSKSKAKSKQKEADADKAVCPYCDYEFCLSCNRLWHSGSCDSVKRREDRQSEKAIKKLGAKPCPKCGVNIEKRGGCDHMRCQNCRHDFCWECLGLFNGNANAHSDTCSHRRPMIAHDIGNFVGDNLTVAQVNGLIEQARQDRDAGRVPRPNVQLMPGVQLVNGAAVVRPPRIAVPQPRPQAHGLDPQVRPRAPAINSANRRPNMAGPRRRIVLREEDEADSNSEEEEQD